MRFELLSRNHDRTQFDCGSEPLNLYLQTTARKHMARGISKTFVLVNPNGKSIIGYFTLSAAEITKSDLPAEIAKRMPKILGVVLLGRLAVDKSYQGKGIGLVLLHEAVTKTVHAAENIGICGMMVKAKDAKAAAFYEHYGFQRGEKDNHLLFLPITTLRKILAD